MGIFKRAAAIGIAAALTATSMSIAAYAQDVTDTGAPLEVTVEGSGLAVAEGYDDEQKAFLKYLENKGSVIYDDEGDGFELDDVLTDDTMITINSGSVDLSAAKYGYFELFKFSEDKSTVVLEETIVIHSHLATRCYCWSIDGRIPPAMGDGFYEVTDEIDGCGVAKEIFRDDLYLTVVGNKISGNLIRQLVDQSYHYNAMLDIKTPYNLNDYDLINVCAYYETEEGDGNMSYAFFTDSYVKANPVQPKPDDEPDDNPAEEIYKVTTDKPFTDEEFAAILEENKTKDVEITVDGVTYTFKKGEMEAVDGAKYDFGATITTDLSKLENPDKALTKENFVLHIDYNYSGKLPATASIKLYVGKEYVGKTLYYSQILENGIKLVQSVVVDSDGYITVTQDHCSEYVFTTEDITKADDSDNSSDESSSTDTSSQPSSSNSSVSDPADNNGNPDTGMTATLTVTFAAILASAAVMIVSKKRK